MPMLTRWDPFAELSRLQNDMNRASTYRERFEPAVDIREEDEAIVIEAEVPGLKADNLKVHVDDNVLTLEGERRFEKEEKKERYHRIERSYGKFVRSFSLPKNVDGEHIDAKLDDGLLTVRLPKRAAPEKRRIQIEPGA